VQLLLSYGLRKGALRIVQFKHARRRYRRASLRPAVSPAPLPGPADGRTWLHDWWHRCLARAGVAPAGTTRGGRTYEARHTAGQRVLDRTGNLKAVQKFLGHASVQDDSRRPHRLGHRAAPRDDAGRAHAGRVVNRSPRLKTKGPQNGPSMVLEEVLSNPPEALEGLLGAPPDSPENSPHAVYRGAPEGEKEPDGLFTPARSA
jgi:hypothetical protein